MRWQLIELSGIPNKCNLDTCTGALPPPVPIKARPANAIPARAPSPEQARQIDC